MKIKAVPFNKFFKNKESIYKNIMILAKRSRQIIDTRYEKVASMKNIEDSDEIVELNEVELNQEKSISLAMDELLDQKLEYRNFEEEQEPNEE